MKDLYKILGVDKDATTEEIRKKYYKLAKKLHPDKGEGSDAVAFKEVAYAYSILSDPDQRARYDRGEPLNDVDNRQSKLAQAMGELLLKAIQKSDVKYTDLTAIMRNELDAAIAETEALKEQGEEAVKKCEEALSRFGGETEMVEALLGNTINNMKGQLGKVQANLDCFKEIYDKVKKMTYKFDKKPKNETNSDYVKVYQTILGNLNYGEK